MKFNFKSQANKPVEEECIPFGKHQGTMLKDTPTEYVAWLALNTAWKPAEVYLETLISAGYVEIEANQPLPELPEYVCLDCTNCIFNEKELRT